MKIGIIPCVGMAFALSGCVAAAVPLLGIGGGLGVTRAVGVSNAKGNMARATALAIGKSVNPDSITIFDTHVSTHEARWVADAPTGRYSCSDDNEVTGPAYCARR